MKSMTGYGKSRISYKNKDLCVEIKTLNSKQADISIRVAPLYRSLEIEINNILKNRLERGKIDCFVNVCYNKADENLNINESLFRSYYCQLLKLTQQVGANPDYLTEYLLRREDINRADDQEPDPQESSALLQAVNQAVDSLDLYRQEEGKSLYNDFNEHVNLIENYSLQVPAFEKTRVPQIKEKLLSRLEELKLSEIDSSRLEQELIYYLEKLDINEECKRLAQHIKYFRECMNEEETVGKKLGFIAQEMGREINTMGSKSNNAEMQQLVVKMKDELEKIKEQTANVL